MSHWHRYDRAPGPRATTIHLYQCTAIVYTLISADERESAYAITSRRHLKLICLITKSDRSGFRSVRCGTSTDPTSQTVLLFASCTTWRVRSVVPNDVYALHFDANEWISICTVSQSFLQPTMLLNLHPFRTQLNADNLRTRSLICRPETLRTQIARG